MRKKIMALIIALVICVSASITWVILQPQEPEPPETPPEDEPKEIVEIDLDELLNLAQLCAIGDKSAEDTLKDLRNKTIRTTGIFKEIFYRAAVGFFGDTDYRNSEDLVIVLMGNSSTMPWQLLYAFPLEELLQAVKDLDLKAEDKVTVEGELPYWGISPSYGRLCDLVISSLTKQSN